MIELHQYPAVWGLSSLSPFCIKVEAYLREKSLPYRVVTEWNPARGPKGKMPFIQLDEIVVADSSSILDFLEEHFGFASDRNQKPEQRAAAIAFQRLIEEHLYFALLYARWVDPTSWPSLVRAFTGFFPPYVGGLFLRLIRRNLNKQAHAQGMGRHTPGEVYARAEKDLRSLSDYLAESAYFLGDEWAPIDASLFAFLITILRQPTAEELKSVLLKFDNLVRYAEREERRLGFRGGPRSKAAV